MQEEDQAGGLISGGFETWNDEPELPKIGVLIAGAIVAVLVFLLL